MLLCGLRTNCCSLYEAGSSHRHLFLVVMSLLLFSLCRAQCGLISVHQVESEAAGSPAHHHAWMTNSATTAATTFILCFDCKNLKLVDSIRRFCSKSIYLFFISNIRINVLILSICSFIPSLTHRFSGTLCVYLLNTSCHSCGNLICKLICSLLNIGSKEKMPPSFDQHISWVLGWSKLGFQRQCKQNKHRLKHSYLFS